MKAFLLVSLFSVSAMAQNMTVNCTEINSATPLSFSFESDGSDLGNVAKAVDSTGKILFEKQNADAMSSYPCSEFGIDVIGTTDETTVSSLDMSVTAVVRCDAKGELWKEINGFQIGLSRRSDFPQVESNVPASFVISQNQNAIYGKALCEIAVK